jgi:hypothetical protein
MIAKCNYTNHSILWYVIKNDLGIFLYFYLNHAIALEGSALGELHYLWLDIYYSLYICLVTCDLSLLWVDRLDMVHSPHHIFFKPSLPSGKI